MAQTKTAVAILGAGTQGRRLAYMWSSNGQDVHLIDSNPEQLKASLAAIVEYRSTAGPRLGIWIWGHVSTYSPESLHEALEHAWLILECVPEKLALKKQVIAQLDASAADGVIVASNSSSYSCSDILEGLQLKDEKRFLSAHSYWPPETCEIEIMGHATTDPAHIATMMEQCKMHGFSPFHVRRSSTGYIYNRIWAAIKRETLLTAAEGVATPEEIDAIFKGVLKTPKGPFEQMDVVGLDVVRDIEQHYADVRQNLPTEPRQYLDRYLEQGNLGVKSGKGFYEYTEEKKDAERN